MSGYTPLGKTIAHWLIDQDMKQKDLALMVGASTAFVSAVMNGKKNMPTKWIGLLPKHVVQKALEVKIENYERKISELKELRK